MTERITFWDIEQFVFGDNRCSVSELQTFHELLKNAVQQIAALCSSDPYYQVRFNLTLEEGQAELPIDYISSVAGSPLTSIVKMETLVDGVCRTAHAGNVCLTDQTGVPSMFERCADVITFDCIAESDIEFTVVGTRAPRCEIFDGDTYAEPDIPPGMISSLRLMAKGFYQGIISGDWANASPMLQLADSAAEAAKLAAVDAYDFSNEPEGFSGGAVYRISECRKSGFGRSFGKSVEKDCVIAPPRVGHICVPVEETGKCACR